MSPSLLGHGTVAARLGMAGLLGAVIGIDREWNRRSAGLRTHMLVGMAAAFFAILATEIVGRLSEGSAAQGDPLRIIEAVTAGVAFLAAGAIIRSGGEVEGVTTAAGLWLAGAVGLACGLGLWTLGAVAAGLGFVVITLLGWVTQRFGPKKDS
ncbi:MAG: MgtC/SapB family protein [Methylobacterium sp.]|nr:MgtC/SapB family protein [Methylobacterium sp.]